MAVDRRETGGRRMVVDMPPVYNDMGAGASRILTQKALEAIIKAGNLVVVTNWIGNGVPQRVAGKDEVLKLPHRLVVLTEPLIEEQPHQAEAKPCYYLLDLGLADPTATPWEGRKTWRKKERHQLYLLGFKHFLSRPATDLIEALDSWRGLYRKGEMAVIFRPLADGTTGFRIDFPSRPFAEPTEQGRLDVAATETGDEVRLIRVKDPKTRALARRIVEINSRQPNQRSKLF